MSLAAAQADLAVSLLVVLDEPDDEELSLPVLEPDPELLEDSDELFDSEPLDSALLESPPFESADFESFVASDEPLPSADEDEVLEADERLSFL